MRYLNKQQIKVVDKFDFDKSTINYTNIQQHREIKKITGDEEIVRAYILTKLVNNLGYKSAHIEKEYDIGRPKVNKPRIDAMASNLFYGTVTNKFWVFPLLRRKLRV